jgi:hypothetical protein
VIIPGPYMSADEQHTRSIRITFVAEPKTLAAGVTRLATAWRQYQSSTPRSPDHAVMI